MAPASKSAASSKLKFDAAWLEEPKYSAWLAANGKDDTSARCLTCNAMIELSTLGRRALDYHCRNRTHVKKEAAKGKKVQGLHSETDEE